MTHTRNSLTLLTLALAGGALFAGKEIRNEHESFARKQVLEQRYDLGLDQNHDFVVHKAHADEKGMVHARMQQHFCGVKVWGGEIITHTDAHGRRHPDTNALHQNIHLSVKPTLKNKEALAVVHEDLQPKGPYAYEPTIELVIYPHENGARSLAYHVHTEIEQPNDTRHTDYIIDAHSGEIINKWNTLQAGDAVGTARTQYSGTVSIHTNLNGSTYELNDVYRGMNIKTYNLNHATSGTGTLYTDADNTWGDGTNYPKGSGTSTTSDAGQTAAVDAHYGIEMTYDFYKNLFGRNGIDGNNRATYSRVHYSTSYDNAFWGPSCFCMTYGDGNYFKSLEALDVAGHEMSHGVCAAEANLTYSGEPGGLNEANSDILGNMVELYKNNNNSLPATVANTNSCWTVGEQLATPSFPTPLRYMYKPSKDGTSPDYWSSSTGGLNVHYSSGPANHMFFFLSQGCATSGDYSSTYAPSGFTGIGPEKAVRIWYKALADYMISSTNYAGARTACLTACSALYGTTGAEYKAVQNAFGAINVGALAPVVTVSITPSATTMYPNVYQLFKATVANASNTAVTWTCTGGTISTSGNYKAPVVTATQTYKVRATSVEDTSKFAEATVTVNPAATITYAEVESNNSTAAANVVPDNVTKITGTISSTTDADFFKINVAAGRTVTVNMTGPSGADFDLYLLNSAGSVLKLSEGGACTESVTYQNTGTTTATYYVKAIFSSGSSLTGAYNLTLLR